jgi:hypothetical protein
LAFFKRIVAGMPSKYGVTYDENTDIAYIRSYDAYFYPEYGEHDNADAIVALISILKKEYERLWMLYANEKADEYEMEQLNMLSKYLIYTPVLNITLKNLLEICATVFEKKV